MKTLNILNITFKEKEIKDILNILGYQISQEGSIYKRDWKNQVNWVTDSEDKCIHYKNIGSILPTEHGSKIIKKNDYKAVTRYFNKELTSD